MEPRSVEKTAPRESPLLQGPANWRVAAVIAIAIVAGAHLASLGTSPPGLWADEASIGYDAWAVGRFGIDQHQTTWPVFFESFGDYKSPLYIYLLAPLTRLFRLTPTLVRIPAALADIAACIVFGITAWWLTRNRWIGLMSFLIAGFTPWVVMEGRVGFEVVILVLLTGIALLGTVRLIEAPSRRWAIVVGVAVAALPFAYATGRLAALLVALVVSIVLGIRPGRRRCLWWVLPPVAISYGFLALWALGHPGALTARYSYIGIMAGSPSVVATVSRGVRNYLHYFGVSFLAEHGDSNLRHNTGIGGMLLLGMLPAVLVGLVWCLKRWREPLPQLMLLGLLVAPVPAALTQEGTPHALRSATMLPFLFAIAAAGWKQLLQLSVGRHVVIGATSVLLVVQASVWTIDLYRSYPDRAIAAFGGGQLEAVSFANDVRGQGSMLVSFGVGDFVYWYALFSLRPDPRVGIWASNVQLASASVIAARSRPGDVAVLGPAEEAPPGSRLLAKWPEADVWLVGSK